MRDDRATLASALLAGALLVGILALGVALRASGPLSTRAIAAEDPYTHVVFTKEALETGRFADSRYLGTSLYPPGLHALMGIFVADSGVSAYAFARFAPLVFGALAIVGMFLLGRRLAGPGAGLAAALVTAVMPEHIFRTELLFPTALDLALLPAFLLLFHVAATEPGRDTRYAAGAGFLAVSAALALAHPWVVPLFAAPALAYAGLRAFREDWTTRQLAYPAALAVLATAFAMASRWDKSDTGFSDFFGYLGPLRFLSELSMPKPLVFVALVVLFGAAAGAGVALVRVVALARSRTPRWARFALAALVAGVLIFLAVKLSIQPPQDVHYAHMFGGGVVLLALAGLVLALVAPSALGDMGLSLTVALFPLTAINVFESPYWPSRTVAFLSVGVALLAASAAWRALHAGVDLIARRRRSGVAPRAAAPMALVACVLLVAGAVAAQPGSPYPWYRLYDDNEFAAFERLADRLAEDEEARAIVFPWQPALLVKALAEPAQARYSGAFFAQGAERSRILAELPGHPKFVVVDDHLAKVERQGKADLSFLDRESYRIVDSGGGVRIYEWEGAS